MDTIHPGTGHTTHIIIMLTEAIAPIIMPVATRRKKITGTVIMTVMSVMNIPIAGIVMVATEMDRKTRAIVAVTVMAPEAIQPLQ
jgi:hypothetical protein